jgi:hypothetical protein
MKNRFLLSTMFLLLLVGFLVSTSYSAPKDLVAPIPTVTITLANETEYEPVHPGPVTQYEFDVYVLQTGTTPWEFSGMQTGLTFNNAIKNGTTTCAWVAGQSDPMFAAAGVAFALPNMATAGVIKIAAKIPSGGMGTGPIISAVGPLGTKFGRLRITCNAGFTNNLPNIQMWQTEASGYPTQPGAYVANDVGGETNVDLLASGTVTYVNNLANGLLPVELSSFTSAAQGRTVVLNWSTKTEKNSDRFEVERSLVSNGTWSTIASVKAAVLSNSTRNYSYTDTKLQSGKYQYRLKMVDNNGSSSYSSVEAAEVAVPKDFSVSQNYPNPFNPTTKIDYQVPVDAKVIMEVYNITGQKVVELVNQEQSAGYYTVDFGASKLSSGVYIYRLAAVDKATGNNFSSIKKMMLLK